MARGMLGNAGSRTSPGGLVGDLSVSRECTHNAWDGYLAPGISGPAGATLRATIPW